MGSSDKYVLSFNKLVTSIHNNDEEWSRSVLMLMNWPVIAPQL
jgi:hypothetical protein